MSWEDVGDTLISMGVPLLGGLLGGPAGAAAGKIVAGLFDTDPKNPDEAMNAIRSDPEAANKLKEYEVQNRVRLQELQLKETELVLADVTSARQREVALASVTGRRDTNQYVLAYITFVGFFVVVGAAIWTYYAPGIDLEENPIILMLMGALISGFTQVLSYYFGSSKGSAEKNAMISARG